MRRALPIPVLSLLVSCATVPSAPPPPDRALAHGSASEAFSCAMRHVNDLGYTVADADREAGFIRAERDRTSLGEALLEGVESFDQLTLTVFPGRDDRVVLRVVAGGYEVETRGDNKGARVSRAGSELAYQHVHEILRGCGEPLVRAVNAPAGAPATRSR